MKMKMVDVAGVETRCILAGDPEAPALFLLHGLALTGDVWVHNIDALARTHRVVVPDMLGHGFTRPPAAARVDIPAKLAHLKALADVLGIERMALCGSSYGALLGALFFLANKDRVSRLVINGSGSCFNTEQQLVDQVKRLHALYAPTLTESTPEMWRARIANNFFDASKVPAELPTIAALCYAYPWAAERWAETMAIIGDADLFRPFRILERLDEITVPTLVMWGRDDRGGSLESARIAIARMPDVRLEVFDGCGHYPMIEHPEEYNRIVADFLRG